MSKWIIDAPMSGKWHLGKPKVIIGSRTGKVLKSYLVTSCNGVQLGGPWGQIESEKPNIQECGICERCLAIAKRRPGMEFTVFYTQSPSA